MRLSEIVESVARDIQRQAERLIVYRQVEQLFKSIELAQDSQVYAYKTLGDGALYIEFSPNYSEDANKDLRPLVHILSRKFHARFDKRKNYEGTAIEYSTEITVKIDGNDQVVRLKVSGVVPKTCRYEEKVTVLRDEEIEEARKTALESVQTTKVEKILVCS